MSTRLLPRSEKGACRKGRSAETRHSGEQNVGKVRPSERQELVPDRDRAADSLRPRVGAACHALGQFLLKHYIGEAEPASRLQHPIYLAEQGFLLRREVDDAVRDDHIKGIVPERQALRFHQPRLGIRNACLLKILLRPRHHGLGQIDPVHHALGTSQLRSDVQVEARAASDIENDRPGLDREQGKGIAHAAKGFDKPGVGGVDERGIIAERQCTLFARGVGELPGDRPGNLGIFAPYRAPDLFPRQSLLAALPGAARRRSDRSCVNVLLLFLHGSPLVHNCPCDVHSHFVIWCNTILEV